MKQSLHRIWRGCTGFASAEASDAAFEDLVRRYTESTRHYHNLSHVFVVVVAVELPFEGFERATAQLLLAAFLHDVIYDPRGKDSEERSAEFASEMLKGLGTPAESREEVARLILLTRDHLVSPEDRDGQILIDADLRVFSNAPTDYDDYAANIRREYAWVPDAEYRPGRRAVLLRFLERPCIYHTAFFKRREAQARANLAREVASLS